MKVLLLLLVLLGVWAGAVVAEAAAGVNRLKLLDQCEEYWYTQTLDHFSFVADEGSSPAQTTFQQRYFVCSRNLWDQPSAAPVFFYTGNEATVELYINNTGLMWENAAKFKALMVFAEHRYFGKSIPQTSGPMLQNLRYLSSAQAIEDYAQLIAYLRTYFKADKSPFIAFGGSYGGMLAAWLRMKHPESVAGSIAASAPILSFTGSEGYDPEGFAAIETADAAPQCQTLVRAGFAELFKLGKTAAGRNRIEKEMRLCPGQLTDASAGAQVAGWVTGAVSSLAEGMYPWASSYLTNGECELPPWPMTAACEQATSDGTVLGALRALSSVYYNCSGDTPCFKINEEVNNETEIVDKLWDWLACTELAMPFATDGVKDMFWVNKWDPTAYIADCKASWGSQMNKETDLMWATRYYGGRRALRYASNIIFSNGEYDPWRAGGVAEASDLPASVVPLLVPKGGHHRDLMFSTQNEEPAVIKVRQTELKAIANWCAEWLTK